MKTQAINCQNSIQVPISDELIAKAIGGMKDKYDGEDWTINGAMYLFASQLADAFATINPAFDREHFLMACGV